jgi:hypothetical protein
MMENFVCAEYVPLPATLLVLNFRYVRLFVFQVIDSCRTLFSVVHSVGLSQHSFHQICFDKGAKKYAINVAAVIVAPQAEVY